MERITFALAIHISSLPLIYGGVLEINQVDTSKSLYTCWPGESCTIKCMSTLACAAKDLYCAEGYDCSLLCGYENACYNAVIHGEKSTHLDVVVTSHEANAERLTIYTPKNDNNDKNSLLCYSGAENSCNNI
eukprot:4582_1